MTVKIDKFGRFVIPKPVRDRLGLEPGSRLHLDVHDNAVVLSPLDEAGDSNGARGFQWKGIVELTER